MKILSRYVLKEFLAPLTYCLAGFVSIYVLFELFGSFSRIMEAKLPLRQTVAYFAAYLSPFFHYLAPAALMLAVLYTMWNFSRHSELIAMRASGISLQTVVRPLMGVALAMAVLVAFVNEYYMPRYANWARQLKTERFSVEKAQSAEKIGYCNSDAHRTWVVKGTHNALCTKLTDIQISYGREDGRRLKNVSAQTAEFLDGEWWLDGVKTQHYGPDGRPAASPDPVLDAMPFRSFPELTETPDDIAMQNSNAKFASVPGKFKYLEKNRDLNGESRNSLRYEAWAQAVSPLACLVITLLAVPGGMASGRQSVFKGVVGALLMLIMYNAAVIACMVFAKTGLMPPVPAAFLPPAMFAVLGVSACYRPYAAILRQMAVYFVLAGVYVFIAHVLETRMSVDRAMAHSLAATVPAMIAAIVTFPGVFAAFGGKTEG